MKGQIRWFDSLRGEGVVRSQNGACYYVHFTAIQGIDKNNYHYPSKTDNEKLSKINNMECEFELFEDSHFTQVSSCKILNF